MALTIATNLPALNVKRHLERNSEVYAKAMERVASGKRINHPGDDAAGLAISESIEAKTRSTVQARRNALDALSFAQVVEGGMSEVSNLAVRLRELSTQAASDSVSDREREMLDMEAQQIVHEIDRLAETTRHFDTQLLNGTSRDFTFQVGTENTEHDRIQYSSGDIDLRASSLGLSGIDLSDSGSAADSLSDIDEGLRRLNMPRAKLGAFQSRIQTVVNQLATQEETLTAAKSRIQDADIATETMNIVKAQVSQHAGVAVLAQANQVPTAALALLRD